MIVRAFDGSKSDLDELIEMFVDLKKYDNEEDMTYTQIVGELYKILYKNGSVCFISETGGTICGFAILFPDDEGGAVAQSLYIKEKFRGSILFGRFLKWLEDWVAERYKYCTVIATNENTYSMYDKRYKKQYSIYKFIPEGV